MSWIILASSCTASSVARSRCDHWVGKISESTPCRSDHIINGNLRGRKLRRYYWISTPGQQPINVPEKPTHTPSGTHSDSYAWRVVLSGKTCLTTPCMVYTPGVSCHRSCSGFSADSATALPGTSSFSLNLHLTFSQVRQPTFVVIMGWLLFFTVHSLLPHGCCRDFSLVFLLLYRSSVGSDILRSLQS